MDIKVIDRKTSEKILEQVYGEKWISLFYGNSVLRKLITSTALQKKISQLYGWLQKTPASTTKIKAFVETFKIEMEKFVVPEGGFKSFDDFFVRKIKKSEAIFPKDKNFLGSPCEARLTVFKINKQSSCLVVKGKTVLLKDLVPFDLSEFEEGFVWVFRLCPVDYHRFHFPDDGKILLQKKVAGKLHSVNPLSLQNNPRIFLENERVASLLETKHFGKIVYIEVGAMCVGTIEEMKREGEVFSRGEEKGCFHFGGSTVVMLTNKNVLPDPDLLQNTEEGFETLIYLSEKIGISI